MSHTLPVSVRLCLSFCHHMVWWSQCLLTSPRNRTTIGHFTPCLLFLLTCLLDGDLVTVQMDGGWLVVETPGHPLPPLCFSLRSSLRQWLCLPVCSFISLSLHFDHCVVCVQNKRQRRKTALPPTVRRPGGGEFCTPFTCLPVSLPSTAQLAPALPPPFSLLLCSVYLCL